MSNNPFLYKDPVTDLVSEIRKDSDLHRQAESLVNEAFGVATPKNLSKEDQDVWNTEVDNIYKQLKEGVQLDELSKKTLGRYLSRSQGDSEIYADYATKWGKRTDELERKSRKRGTTPSTRAYYKNRAKVAGDVANEYERLSVNRDIGFKRALGKIVNDKPAKKRDRGYPSKVKVLAKEGVQLDELSKKTLGRYLSRSRVDSDSYASTANDYDKRTKDFEKKSRRKGITKSAKTYYKNRAKATSEITDKYERAAANREIGFQRALGKIINDKPAKKRDQGYPSKVKVLAKEDVQTEGYASIGYAFDKFGDVNQNAKFYGNKPKETKKGAEPGAGDTYKGVNSPNKKRVRFVKTVKEETVQESVVTKDQLAKSGLTLGQFLNKQRGLKAVKGGANDPTSSNFRDTRVKPTVPSAQGIPATPKPVDQQSTIKASGSPSNISKPVPAAPSMANPKPETSSVSGIPGNSTAPTTIHKSPLSSISKGVGGADPGSIENAKRRAGTALEEHVMIGDRSYKVI